MALVDATVAGPCRRLGPAGKDGSLANVAEQVSLGSVPLLGQFHSPDHI